MTGKTQAVLRGLFIVCCSLISSIQLNAAEPTWDPARVTSPDSVEELRALETTVKRVVEQVTPSTVGLFVGRGAGSGVIVSENGLILTAAHVIGDPGTPMRIVLSDGTIVRGRSLGLNRKVDSGMAIITSKPPKNATWKGAKDGKWPAAPIGESQDLKKGQWVISLGHPGGPRENRTPPLRLGRFDRQLEKQSAMRTDCVLVGGDSGGPLFNLNGEVVGIHSRIGIFLEFNMHIPTAKFQRDWDDLKEEVALDEDPKVTLGIVFPENSMTIEEVEEDSAADAAGLEVGDKLLKLKQYKIDNFDDLKKYLTGCPPTRSVELTILRDGEEKKLTIRPRSNKR